MADIAKIEAAFAAAKEVYAEWGVDVDAALAALEKIPVSLHCWQGDDVAGFESQGGLSDGGIQTTGSYPGAARNGDELRADLEKAYGLIPGKHRLNLHAIYAETGGKKVERNELDESHFASWIDWAKAQGLGLDFNGSFFSHELAKDGFTLTSRDEKTRKFWVEHAQSCRRIGAAMGRATGSPCVVNVWIPDGYKDTPFDRKGPREILQKSLDEIFAEKLDKNELLDAVECKLFGIGSESYVAGSHEFYMGYAVKNETLLCLDAGHFHPTEVISDKISSVLQFVPEILLHVSRGVRWDSDHVVVMNDELAAIASELVRGDFVNRTHIGLDFFDASINRLAAWVIGCRSMVKALLCAILEPAAKLREVENAYDFTSRLALLEEIKHLPAGAIWNYYCAKQNVPVGAEWLKEVKTYEQDVLLKR